MARQASLASMSIDALVKLKDSVAEALTNRATQLRKQLMHLDGAGKAPSQSPVSWARRSQAI